MCFGDEIGAIWKQQPDKLKQGLQQTIAHPTILRQRVGVGLITDEKHPAYKQPPQQSYLAFARTPLRKGDVLGSYGGIWCFEDADEVDNTDTVRCLPSLGRHLPL